MIPIITALCVATVLSVITKNKDKVDKGFAVNYFHLSYRRKMIRTFINVPIIAFVLLALYFFTNLDVGVLVGMGVLMLIATVIQLIYNYTMWKKNEV